MQVGVDNENLPVYDDPKVWLEGSGAFSAPPGKLPLSDAQSMLAKAQQERAKREAGEPTRERQTTQAPPPADDAQARIEAAAAQAPKEKRSGRVSPIRPRAPFRLPRR